MEHTVLPPWALLAYLAAGVLFILSLRGLSSPYSAKTGNRLGMLGMLIAVVTTLLTALATVRWGPTADVPGARIGPVFAIDWLHLGKILAAVALGGAIGLVMARRIQMTAMPSLSRPSTRWWGWRQCWWGGRPISIRRPSASSGRMD